ncbi:SIR2 family protein [Dongia soli]|uniref:SIR2 family protein n=1 Tax=Dongia soli TaxID=600628 RepID=A0ABU5EG58_9PROT|nr:SIR2 family protein [Dongia soli]MDY0885206.1 SIR2 family protein [Dongia soli]
MIASEHETEMPELGIDDFTRRFSLRAGNLMWLLGAGASASAGIPTAWDMIWEFKQLLFISQRRISPKMVADLTNAAVREQLQAHIDSSGSFPAPDSADEYALLFEAVFPSEADRRTYLDTKLSGAKPSYGHLVLATLMKAQLSRLVWTTNFDPLIADACAKVYGTTGSLTAVNLDAPDLAAQAINESRWPIEVKLHGDFRSRRLKNTGDELRQQDARLRQVLIDCCRRFGLVVAGYSGRDNSIMDALEEALEQSNPFPNGLFWLHRGKYAPLPRVKKLLKRANEAGVDAGLVRIENFDEALRDLTRLIEVIDTKALDVFTSERRRWSPAPRAVGGSGWPVVRLNALPVKLLPTMCRRIVCQIGGISEVRAAAKHADANVLVTRTKAGVLAYGSDSALRAAFEPFGIKDFSLHTIEDERLRYDSGERGLLRDSLTTALARHHKLDVIRRRSTDLLAPVNPLEEKWRDLQKLVGPLTGVVKHNPELHWREGIGVRLDWADDRLWLLVEARTVFDGVTDANRTAATDFARERTVRRYNQVLNDLVSFWAITLADDGNDLPALGVGDGVDAVFRLSSDTAFSRRIHA